MKKVIDLTRVTMSAYNLAKVIEDGYYSNVLYFEFHNYLTPESPVYDSKRLEEYRDYSKEFYPNFISQAYPDEYEAVIDIAVNLGGQWFICYESGANYYFGFGPQGIFQLRKACSSRNIPIIVLEERLEDWLKGQSLNENANQQNEFERVVKIIRNMGADFERRQNSYPKINEESIRDQLLGPINASVNGRANGEAKNGKGKTDILIRTEHGDNEYIFELKVWKGIETLKSAIEQLTGYLSWNNNNCGIVIINYNKDFTKVLSLSKEYLKEEFDLLETEPENDREFKFRVKNNFDVGKSVEMTLMFINL